MVRTNVPQSVRALRRRRGWRQSDLAERSGVSRELISRIERGGLRGVTLASLERVGSALGATVSHYPRSARPKRAKRPLTPFRRMGVDQLVHPWWDATAVLLANHLLNRVEVVGHARRRWVGRIARLDTAELP